MKNIILKYWWVLPILLFLCMFGFVFSFLHRHSILIDGLFILVVILLLVSWCVLLFNKKWGRFLLSFGISAIITAVLGFPLVLGLAGGADGFGREHKIPDGLEYNLPFDVDSNDDVLIDSLDTDTYLQVWNGIQGGIYRYDFYYPPLPAGKVFLRCFEVTENIPLSTDRLPGRSTVSVDGTSAFSQIVNHQEFTIYEGDWGDYFAARIEVWFRDAASMQEKKLCEKIYRVEGWMR